MTNETDVFQCPTSGSVHLYDVIDIVYVSETVFQCPTLGSSHFYEEKMANKRKIWIVSMPYIGLIPFLRYPLSTPDKIGISRLDFRGYFTEYSEN